MSRVVGTEVEYGISAPFEKFSNPILTSTQAVLAYAAGARLNRAKRTRWDYNVESPLRDARGFDYGRNTSVAPIVDPDEVGSANVILTNGARLYVDHAHPEYSAPEVTDPLDAVVWDKAGERIMEAAARYSLSVPGNPVLQLYKNNIDGKGASYGTHENYLMRRDTDFGAIIRGLIPFFVSRQIVCGSGRVGIGQTGSQPGYQLSQRADYIEVEVGLETTLKRGIINTRDEPHADSRRFRRLHVIIGDANLSEFSTYLKIGTTMLVLDLIEAIDAGEVDPSQFAQYIEIINPVSAVQKISHDPTLRQKVDLKDGRSVTGLEIQKIYWDSIQTLIDKKYDGLSLTPERTHHVMELWKQVLEKLENDPLDCADLLDWPAKLQILEGFRQRENLDWPAPRLSLIDLQYSDVRLDKGLYNRLVARGSVRRLLDENDVIRAMTTPPTTTRAYFWGECMRKFPDAIAAASWDSVIFDVGNDDLLRIPMLEPLRGSYQHVGELLDKTQTVDDLIEKLRAQS